MDKLIYAPIDNKNLLEDPFEDGVFADFMAAPDHRHNGIRHLYGTRWAEELGGAFLEVEWCYGGHTVSIKVLACNQTEDFDSVRNEVFACVRDEFSEWENEDNENLRVRFKEIGNTISVSFYFEEQ